MNPSIVIALLLVLAALVAWGVIAGRRAAHRAADWVVAEAGWMRELLTGGTIDGTHVEGTLGGVRVRIAPRETPTPRYDLVAFAELAYEEFEVDYRPNGELRDVEGQLPDHPDARAQVEVLARLGAREVQYRAGKLEVERLPLADDRDDVTAALRAVETLLAIGQRA